MIFHRKGVSQANIAAYLGASQGQVSRLLAGKLRRTSRLFDELCLYAQKLEGGVSAEMVRANDELVGALATAWDGSAEHAKALAMVIRSLSILR